MDVAMMQPTFMPWQGYFELIYKSQIFVFLNDFQFSVQSYHQRNRLFVDKGKAGWYTVPVRKTISFKAPLSQTKINEATLWREKMWKRIEFNYCKTDFFAQVSPLLKEWLFAEYSSLAELNISFIKMVCSLMGLKRKFRLSSEFYSQSLRSFRVLELLRWCNAKRYFCAHGSFEYMKEDNVFPDNEVEVLFQNFKPKAYMQNDDGVTFVPFLSVCDALMNVGPDETLELIKRGTAKWLSWEEMKLK